MRPLDHDPNKNGAPSDHRIVLTRPINTNDNKPVRNIRKVVVRPIPQSGVNLYRDWLVDQTWAEILQTMLVLTFEEILPQKIRKICSDDQPWITFKMKKVDRKGRGFFRRSAGLKSGEQAVA